MTDPTPCSCPKAVWSKIKSTYFQSESLLNTTAKKEIQGYKCNVRIINVTITPSKEISIFFEVRMNVQYICFSSFHTSFRRQIRLTDGMFLVT